MPGIILTENLVNKLIQKATNFENILSVLNYLGKKFKSVIAVIMTNFDKILSIIIECRNNKEKKKKNFVIEIDKYSTPNSQDNLELIFPFINQLINLEQLNGDPKILKFSSDFFIPYVNFNRNNNITNLIFLKELISQIKKLDEKFEFKQDMEKHIHETGLKLIEEKKMNNQDILLFIKKDEYYNNKKYEKNNTLRTLKVFDGLDIKTLSLVDWKKYNFMEIFKNQLKNFSIKISYFVKHMKDFGLLYELFNINEIQKIPHEYANALKNRYILIFS